MLLSQLLSDDYPAWLQVAGVGASLGLVAYTIKEYRKDRPLKGFPVITLDGKSAKETWLLQGNRAITEGLRQVCCLLVGDIHTRCSTDSRHPHSSRDLFKS